MNSVVANGIDLANIAKIFNGDDIGTLFPGSDVRPQRLQHWLAHAATSTSMKDVVQLSKAAARRLAAGMTRMALKRDEIIEVCGILDPNTPVELQDAAGQMIGRAFASACMNAPTLAENQVKGFTNMVKTPGYRMEDADPSILELTGSSVYLNRKDMQSEILRFRTLQSSATMGLGFRV